MSRWIPCAALLLAPAVALADIAPECQGLAQPPDYNEQRQQDFLQNYPALALTFSPIHSAVPHEPGHGAIGVDLAIIPPLACGHRYVLDWTKTEDTNVTPIAPKLRASFAFPEILGAIRTYAGVAYTPPVPVGGARTVILSGEFGIGGRFDAFPLELGARFHATSVKMVADIAKAFDEEHDPAVEDLYVASTFGADAIVGWALGFMTPFVAVGFTDASTYFYIGDDGVVANNYHPYAGLTFSAGLEGLVAKHFRWGAELYGAPGGFSLPDKEAETSGSAASYGRPYTGRLRLAYEF